MTMAPTSSSCLRWRGELAPNATKFDGVDDRWMTFSIPPCCRKVRDVGCPLGSNRFGKGATAARSGIDWTATACLGISRWRIVCRDHAKCAAFMEIERAELGFAEPHSIRQ